MILQSSGNPILDKNLACINKYNPELVERILNIKMLLNNFEITENKKQEPNMIFNTIPLHSNIDAEKEALDEFAKVQNTPTSRHIVFGIGLGHLFQLVCEKSKGIVFLYEPNIEILRVTLEIVDFSNELSKENVFVFDKNEVLKIMYKRSYIQGCNSYFITLPSYRNVLYRNEINHYIEEYNIMVASCISVYVMSRDMEKASFDMLLKNFPYLLKASPLQDYENIYEGKTALVVAAGPTLDENIEIIKKYKDNVVIFCVGTAYKTLMKNGIKPDFVNVVEIKDVSCQLKDVDISELNLITEAYTSNEILKLDVKNRFLFPSSLCCANVYWGNLCDVNTDDYQVKGTVSYSALASAKMLGFKKIVFVGQDLAFVDNKCYTKDSDYSFLSYKYNDNTKQYEFFSNVEKQKNLDEKDIYNKTKYTELSNYMVKGITGEMVPTMVGYATFIEEFQEFAFLNKELEFINTSLKGAQINGFKNLSLEDALKNSLPIQKISDFKTHQYCKNSIKQNVNKSKQNLLALKPLFIKAKDLLHKYEKEVNRNKGLTPNAISYLKSLLSLYGEIANNNGENELFYSISYVEEQNMKFILKEYEEYKADEIKNIFRALRKYFINIEQGVLATINKLSELEANIDEF